MTAGYMLTQFIATILVLSIAYNLTQQENDQ